MNERMAMFGHGKAYVVTPGSRGIELDVERDEVGMIAKVSLTIERPLEVSMNKYQGPVDLALAMGLDVQAVPNEKKDRAMNKYTTEDFKNARFAEHYDGATARRARHGKWDSGPSGRRRSDEDMAGHGWRPIREERSHVETIAERKDRAQEINDLRKAIEDREEVIDHLQDELSLALSRMTDAEEYAAKYDTINLDRLREAWEQAEVPTEDTPIRKGDVVIILNDDGIEAIVRKSLVDFKPTTRAIRVLSRAPRREPWRDLADVLRNYADHHFDGTEHTDAVAKHLHAKGVRVVKGGDES